MMPHTRMDPFEFTEEGVRKLLSGLNPNKAAGPNKLQPWVLKELAGVLAPMVTLFYNASKTQQKLPRDCKRSYNFQKGREVQNIQPLSCFPHICSMQMYGTHCNCGQSGNAISYQEQHPVQPPAWLQFQTLNRNTID